MPTHAVVQGDSLATIAALYGFRWQTLWEHPDNQELREKRGSPNILWPGDQVVVPDPEPKQVALITDKRHTFKIKIQMIHLHLRMASFDRPRADEGYNLDVDGTVFEGRTDGDGKITVSIPVSTKAATLQMEEDAEPIRLQIGGLDPLEEISGVQQRLRNLGLGCVTTGTIDEATRIALRRFQTQAGLPDTGEVDEATHAALRTHHLC